MGHHRSNIEGIRHGTAESLTIGDGQRPMRIYSYQCAVNAITAGERSHFAAEWKTDADQHSFARRAYGGVPRLRAHCSQAQGWRFERASSGPLGARVAECSSLGASEDD